MLSNLRTIIDARRTNDGSESSHDAAIMDSLIESGGAPGGGGGVVLSSSAGGASGGASDGSAGVVDGGGADTGIRRNFPSSQDGGSVFVERRSESVQPSKSAVHMLLNHYFIMMN